MTKIYQQLLDHIYGLNTYNVLAVNLKTTGSVQLRIETEDGMISIMEISPIILGYAASPNNMNFEVTKD